MLLNLKSFIWYFMHFTFNFRFKHLPTYILFPMNHLKAVHFNVGICSIGYWTAKVIHSILQPVCPMTNDFPKAFSPQFLCSIAFGPLLPFKGDIAHESNYNNHF